MRNLIVTAIATMLIGFLAVIPAQAGHIGGPPGGPPGGGGGGTPPVITYGHTYSETTATDVWSGGYQYDFCSAISFKTTKFRNGNYHSSWDYITLDNTPSGSRLSSFLFSHSLPGDFQAPPDVVVKARWILKGSKIDHDDTSNQVNFESTVSFFLNGRNGTDWTSIYLTGANIWNQVDGDIDATLSSIDDGEAKIKNAWLYLDYESVVSDSSSPNVPEPATMLLFGSGIAGLAVYRKRKSRV